MKVGLINIEPKIVNSALMQIAHHHRHLGDTVKWAGQIFYDDYDKLYCSSLFAYTNKKDIPKRTLCGGSGFNLTTTLPFDCDYDYSIYPKCDYSIVWFSRGCIRNCPFCVVPEKEGSIRPVIPKPLNPKGEYVIVRDNNFFASPSWEKAIAVLERWDMPVYFNAGLDIRLLKSKHCKTLNNLRLHKQIYIAWDNPRIDIKKKLRRMIKIIPSYKIACYVLIGYWSTPKEDLYRVETLRNFGIDPFVMPYDRTKRCQRRFARWVNHKATFKTVKWEDYK